MDLRKTRIKIKKSADLKTDRMELIDFSKPTIMCDVILVVENKKLYCNRAILSIWSPVFETMFKSNFKEKESSEISLPGN